MWDFFFFFYFNVYANKAKIISRALVGLGIPDMFIAQNCQYPLPWAFKIEHPEPGSWRWLEQQIVNDKCKGVSLSSLWYHAKSNKCIENSLITFSCEVAKVIQKRLRISGQSLPSFPPWNNPSFLAGNKPLTNQIWLGKNVTCLGQVVKDGELLSFQKINQNITCTI